MKFLVCKEGVYIQNVMGPFDSEKDASKAAVRLAAKDEDSYHSWNVYEVHPSKGLVKILFSVNKSDYGKQLEMFEDA